MRASAQGPGKTALPPLVLLLAAAAAGAEAPPGERPVPLAVRDGRSECVLPTADAGTKYFLVIGCLSQGPGPYHVRLRTEPATNPTSLPRDDAPPDDGWT